MILYPHEFAQLKQFIDRINLDIEMIYKHCEPNTTIDCIKVEDYYAETKKVHTTVTIDGIDNLPKGITLNADSVQTYARTKANEKSVKLSYVLDFDEYLK
jgi:hypothetical protein